MFRNSRQTRVNTRHETVSKGFGVKTAFMKAGEGNRTPNLLITKLADRFEVPPIVPQRLTFA